MRYKIPNYVPIVFYNLSRYDTHLFISELGKKFDMGKVGIIAENKEKYISFNIDIVVDSHTDNLGEVKEKKIQLRFIDSKRFMVSSLNYLTNNLIKGGHQMTGFEDYSEAQYELLMRKGVYQYEHMTSWDKFDETSLPPKEVFYSKLNMSNISDEEYSHTQAVWAEFGIRNLGEYHNLYLQTDVILLTNVFEMFGSTCLWHYGLDLTHFYSAPGLEWQACLKITGINLELLSDPDMLLMFQRGIRGGITQAVHQCASANNKYMGDQFNPEEESSYLQYLDMNDLYGWAMSQLLPTGGFKWVDPSQFKPDSYANESYLLEVNVWYPKELHNLHNDLLFMCKKMVINGIKTLVLDLDDK